MIVRTKERLLIKNNGLIKKLTPKETKLLMVLGNEETNTYEQCTKFIFNKNDDKCSRGNLQTILSNLRNKTYLRIRVISTVGLRLEQKIWFE